MKNMARWWEFITLLLVTLCAAARSQCESYSPEPARTCALLYKAFETALVGNDENLYLLRVSYFPTSQATPTLVNVFYEINFQNVSEEMCNRTASDNSTEFNTSTTHYPNYGWTSSVFYTVLHPALLNRMQIQLFMSLVRYWIHDTEHPDADEVGFLWDGVGSVQSIRLSLDITNLPCTPSELQVNGTLKNLNAMLRAYADAQSNLTSWNTQYSGYTLNGSVLDSKGNWDDDSDNYDQILVANTGVTGMVLLLIFGFSILYGMFKGFIYNIMKDHLSEMNHVPFFPKTQLGTYKENDFMSSIYWASTSVTSFLCIFIIIWEFLRYSVWCSQSSCDDIVTGLKFFTVLELLFVFIPAGIFWARNCPVSPPSITLQVLMYFVFFWLIPLLVIGVVIRQCIKKKWGIKEFFKCWEEVYPRVFLFLTSLGFGIFILSVIHAVIPTLFLAFIYPVKVLAFYTFIVPFILSVIIILVTLGEKIDPKDTFNKYRKEEKWIVLFFIVLFRIFIIVELCLVLVLVGGWFGSVYQVIVAKGASDSSYLFFVSFVPGLLLSSPVVWWVKKFWKKLTQEEKSTQTSSTSTQEPETTYRTTGNTGTNVHNGFENTSGEPATAPSPHRRQRQRGSNQASLNSAQQPNMEMNLVPTEIVSENDAETNPLIGIDS